MLYKYIFYIKVSKKNTVYKVSSPSCLPLHLPVTSASTTPAPASSYSASDSITKLAHFFVLHEHITS